MKSTAPQDSRPNPLLSDCSSADTPEELKAAVEITWPRFAQTVITLKDFAGKIS